MNIDELSRLAIEQVQEELKLGKKLDYDIIDDDTNNEVDYISEEEQLLNKIESLKIAQEQTLAKIMNKPEPISSNDKKFLENIKERILVLFEALNTKQSEEDLKHRLNITISFIEFLLATIEERLENKDNV